LDLPKKGPQPIVSIEKSRFSLAWEGAQSTNRTRVEKVVSPLLF
jgi:hypothetical protein